VSLHEFLGTELPIVQAPMAGVQDYALAIAVSRAGGLGSLPAARLDAPTLRAALQAIREAEVDAYNLNFFCHQPPEPDRERDAAWRAALAPYYEELELDPSSIPDASGYHSFGPVAAELVEEFRPPVVSFHFGLPAEPLFERVRATGARILSTATTVAEARWLEDRGVDAIILQGIEAGGHRGSFLENDSTPQQLTLDLLREMVAESEIPVIAAGGIADHPGVAEALAIGAAAVQIGTTYLLADEAMTSTVHRAALSPGLTVETAITNVFTGRPARGIVNRLMREIGPLSPLAPPFPLAAAAVAPLRARAESLGSRDFSPLWAGRNTSGCRRAPAAEITRKLAAR
jgi:nitronate monooxygenase